MPYTGLSKTKYQLEESPLASGGEGQIYRVRGGKGKKVAKIYRADKLTQELEEKLKHMVKRPPERHILNQVAWPLDVLYDTNTRFCGFVMPELNIDSELREIYQYPPTLGLSAQQKIIIAENICAVITAVHNAGYVFGDFNPRNIGVYKGTGSVAFLDTDSYHVLDKSKKRLYRCKVCADGYAAPELLAACAKHASANPDDSKQLYEKTPLPTFTEETDNFALAIHIFKLLMNGFTPFGGIIETVTPSKASPSMGNAAIRRNEYCFRHGYKPLSAAVPPLGVFPKEIADLFTRAFMVVGTVKPSQRPTSAEWHRALSKYEHTLVTCPENKLHQYDRKNGTCPFCEADKRYQSAISRRNVQAYAPSREPVSTIQQKTYSQAMTATQRAPVQAPRGSYGSYSGNASYPAYAPQIKRRGNRALGVLSFLAAALLLGLGAAFFLSTSTSDSEHLSAPAAAAEAPAATAEAAFAGELEIAPVASPIPSTGPWYEQSMPEPDASEATITQQVMVDAYAAPINGGKVTGGGTYETGQAVTLSASANSGYVFDGWYEGDAKVSESSGYSFTAASNMMLQARFAQTSQNQTFTITAWVSSNDAGYVKGGGTYQYGANVTLSATANNGYVFDGWYDDETRVSDSSGYSFTVTSDVSLQAKFTPTQNQQAQNQQAQQLAEYENQQAQNPQAFTISASASPGYGGTVAGVPGRAVYSGDVVALNATANSGYIFNGWYEGGTLVSADSLYRFTVTSNRTLHARFTQAPQNQQTPTPQNQQAFAISASASPNDGGSVSGGGTYQNGATAALNATAYSGYIFDGWYEGNTRVGTNPQYSFTVTSNRTLQARFTQTQNQQVTITAYPVPSNGGIVTGGGLYNLYSGFTLKATPNPGWTFVGWRVPTDPPGYFHTDTAFSHTGANGNWTYEAHFTQAPQDQQTFTVTVSSSPNVGISKIVYDTRYGSLTSNAGTATLTMRSGGSVVVYAYAKDGYTFDGWYDGNTRVGTSETYAFTVESNMALQARVTETQ